MFPKNAIPTQFFDFDVYQFPDNELIDKFNTLGLITVLWGY